MKNVILAIKELLEASVANSQSPLYWVKKVFFGDPMVIPESDLPAIAIQPVSTDYVMRGSRYDQKQHTVEIRLVYNQKQYFWQNLATGVSITAGSFSVNAMSFTATAHSLAVGDSIVISGVLPEAYNGTYLVATVPNANTFTVAKSIDPSTFATGGIVQKATNDKVFAIEDAISKVESVNADHSTAALSVCGTIQGNSSLPYTDGAVTRNAAEIAQIRSVSYTLSENRWFPSFEVVATVVATVVGDR